MTETLVLDASAMVTLLIGGPVANKVAERIAGTPVHVPAHFDAEVLSALGRLHRANELDADEVAQRLVALAAAPFERHAIGPLLTSAWGLPDNVRPVDALYISLAVKLSVPIITVDRGLAAATPHAELLRV